MNHKYFILLVFLVSLIGVDEQVKTASADTDWKRQQAVLKNTMEADVIIRMGDIGNPCFGWPESFDPFCGMMSESHPYPWDINSSDLPNFDRILVSSKFNSNKKQDCGSDGYSGSFDAV